MSRHTNERMGFLVGLHVKATLLHRVHIRRGHVKKFAVVTKLPFRGLEL